MVQLSNIDKYEYKPITTLWLFPNLFAICIGLIIAPPMVGIIPLSLWEVMVFMVIIVAYTGEFAVRKVRGV